MATAQSTTKAKSDLTRSRSLGRKPKPVQSSEPESNPDGSGPKTSEKKPLPNYLKPTISSRPDPVKLSKKNNALEDNQKLLRRRSFDRPSPSSLTSPPSSSSRKSLNISPRDKPVVPREKVVTGLRSTGSSRGGLRGSSNVKSTPMASRGSLGAKKSGPRGSKKEGSENVPKKSSGKEITSDSSPLASAHVDEEEITKVEINEQVSDHIDQISQPEEETETGPVAVSTGEEPKEPDNTQEHKEEDDTKADDDEEENIEKVVTEMKETAEVEEPKDQVEVLLPEEGTKKEVVQCKKESPTAYNDVIASKMQENSTKRKVLALAGAFQTVIDYETAASK